VLMEATKGADSDLKAALSQSAAIGAVRGCNADLACIHALRPGGALRAAELDALRARINQATAGATNAKAVLDSMLDLSENESRRLQTEQDKLAKFVATLANTLKSVAATANSITPNIK
jgi:hypothetical protein